jgi:hypothetical protein
MKRSCFLLSVGLASIALPAAGADFVACIVASLPNNANYYGNATTTTKLKCEFTNKDYYPTLPELYRQGWRLLEVIGGDLALANRGSSGISPLYLLEREMETTPPSDKADAKKKSR